MDELARGGRVRRHDAEGVAQGDGGARGPFRAGLPGREGVVQACGHRRLATRRARVVEAEVGGMSVLKPLRPWPLDTSGKPKRRVSVAGNPGVYWRADGTFEVGYRDADGRQRWRGPFDTITAARAARGDARARARGGERESANPRLKFREAANRWLAEQVAELRPST